MALEPWGYREFEKEALTFRSSVHGNTGTQFPSVPRNLRKNYRNCQNKQHKMQLEFRPESLPIIIWFDHSTDIFSMHQRAYGLRHKL